MYIANPGQLVVPFPGTRRADFSLNLANREALAFLAGQGITEYTPSVELTAQELRQMDAAGGHRELIVYGRLPLMQLRHCPIRAALDALNGWDPTGGCLYYYNPKTAVDGWIRTRTVKTVIGNHYFAV